MLTNRKNGCQITEFSSMKDEEPKMLKEENIDKNMESSQLLELEKVYKFWTQDYVVFAGKIFSSINNFLKVNSDILVLFTRSDLHLTFILLSIHSIIVRPHSVEP